MRLQQQGRPRDQMGLDCHLLVSRAAPCPNGFGSVLVDGGLRSGAGVALHTHHTGCSGPVLPLVCFLSLVCSV